MLELEAKSNKHYDWIVMPDIYIATALLLCEQMASGDVIKRLGLHSSHPDYELILPLVFNFKQGIELYIKALGIIDYSKYQKVHNLKQLFEELKKNAKKTTNETSVNQLYDNTWNTIKKYYYGRYIPFNRGSNFADKKNEAERYPEYKSRTSRGKIYRIPDRYKWVTNKVIKEIEKDIKLIESKFAQAKRDIKPTKRFIYGRTRK